MSSPSTKETKARFNKLSNCLNIKSLKGNRNFILHMKRYIDDGENLCKKTIDLSIKNKQIAFCSNLIIGILSFSSYVENESMNVI